MSEQPNTGESLTGSLLGAKKDSGLGMKTTRRQKGAVLIYTDYHMYWVDPRIHYYDVFDWEFAGLSLFFLSQSHPVDTRDPITGVLNWTGSLQDYSLVIVFDNYSWPESWPFYAELMSGTWHGRIFHIGEWVYEYPDGSGILHGYPRHAERINHLAPWCGMSIDVNQSREHMMGYSAIYQGGTTGGWSDYVTTAIESGEPLMAGVEGLSHCLGSPVQGGTCLARSQHLDYSTGVPVPGEEWPMIARFTRNNVEWVVSGDSNIINGDSVWEWPPNSQPMDHPGNQQFFRNLVDVPVV